MIKDIADDEILAACRDAKTVTLKAGETLFREGYDAQAMYVVKQGTLRIVSGSTILETVREGGIVGEMAIIEAHMPRRDRKSTRLNSSHVALSYAVFCLKKKKKSLAVLCFEKIKKLKI